MAASDDSGAWRPTAATDALRLRARLLASCRAFFAERGVLEVETPLVGSAAATDVHIASFEVRDPGSAPAVGYLQSSPEFPMKRLLAAGSGPIYQICKAFRAGEAGRYHNPEFTLLEWYRPGWDHHALMEEVAALLEALLGPEIGPLAPARRMSYAEAFRTHADLDPFRTPDATLRERARALGVDPASARRLERDACLELILSRVVQPALGAGAVFIHDFPATQASLARIRRASRTGEPPLAERFELFLDGMELANGYHELTDAREQRRRFERDLEERRRRGLARVPLDGRLLAAMAHGLPRCAGVALGFDRLVMAALGASALEAVVAFPASRA